MRDERTGDRWTEYGEESGDGRWLWMGGWRSLSPAFPSHNYKLLTSGGRGCNETTGFVVTSFAGLGHYDGLSITMQYIS